jgi:hypothetical protein
MSVGRRAGRWLVALCGVLPAVFSLAQEPATPPAFPSRAEAITVDVVVVGRDGRPVTGLGREDFTLLEDGRPQTVVGFETRSLPKPGSDDEKEAAVVELADGKKAGE